MLFLSCNSNNTQEQKNITDTTIKAKTNSDKASDSVDKPQLVINQSAEKINLIPKQIHLSKGIDFKLNIPAGFDISVAAEGLNRLRFLSKAPDGRLFATDMHDRSDNNKGSVYVFDNWNHTTKKFEDVKVYLDSLHNPNQVAFFDQYIYVAETGRLTRYLFRAGDTVPQTKPEVIATFPNYGLSYKYGGWHLTRSLAFHEKKLYVSVGSSCNACIETEDIRASIIQMNPDGTGKMTYARGLRNSVGIKWIGDKLLVTEMGRDLIGPDKPEDKMQWVSQDGFYGWPFYYQYQNKIYADTRLVDSVKAKWVTKPPVAFAGFQAHTAPLGFEYMQSFKNTDLENSLLVCLHGSTSVWRQRGNSIVKVVGGNVFTDVVNGFLTGKTEADRHGRPCDILMNDDHSFYFTDDLNGVLYYVWEK